MSRYRYQSCYQLNFSSPGHLTDSVCEQRRQGQWDSQMVVLWAFTSTVMLCSCWPLGVIQSVMPWSQFVWMSSRIATDGVKSHISSPSSSCRLSVLCLKLVSCGGRYQCCLNLVWWQVSMLSEACVVWWQVSMLSEACVVWWQGSMLSEACVVWWQVLMLSEACVVWWQGSMLSEACVVWWQVSMLR